MTSSILYLCTGVVRVALPKRYVQDQDPATTETGASIAVPRNYLQCSPFYIQYVKVGQTLSRSSVGGSTAEFLMVLLVQYRASRSGILVNRDFTSKLTLVCGSQESHCFNHGVIMVFQHFILQSQFSTVSYFYLLVVNFFYRTLLTTVFLSTDGYFIVLKYSLLFIVIHFICLCRIWKFMSPILDKQNIENLLFEILQIIEIQTFYIARYNNFSIDITDIKNFIFDITQNIDIYRFQIEGINISVLF